MEGGGEEKVEVCVRVERAMDVKRMRDWVMVRWSVLMAMVRWLLLRVGCCHCCCCCMGADVDAVVFGGGGDGDVGGIGTNGGDVVVRRGVVAREHGDDGAFGWVELQVGCLLCKVENVENDW